MLNKYTLVIAAGMLGCSSAAIAQGTKMAPEDRLAACIQNVIKRNLSGSALQNEMARCRAEHPVAASRDYFTDVPSAQTLQNLRNDDD